GGRGGGERAGGGAGRVARALQLGPPAGDGGQLGGQFPAFGGQPVGLVPGGGRGLPLGGHGVGLRAQRRQPTDPFLLRRRDRGQLLRGGVGLRPGSGERGGRRGGGLLGGSPDPVGGIQGR